MVAAFLLGVFLWGRYVHDTTKEDYIRVTGEGIAIGYSCQRKGWDLAQCREDYQRFMRDPHP